MMPMFRRRKGEKSTLLSKCGELLFGCTGELLPTQGIYVPKSLSSTLKLFICKRTVWVPDSLLHECLVHNLESFDATLPFSVQKVVSLHRFGLCGVSPTRTIHAEDKAFLLLAKIPHKQFAVYGIIEMGSAYLSNPTSIVSITTNKDDILHCVNMIKSEIVLHQQMKQFKNKTSPSVLMYDIKDKESDVVERKNEPQELLGVTEQCPVQLKSTETESDLSVCTPEIPAQAPTECANPSQPLFQGVYMPNQNAILWFPFVPSLGTSEPPEDSNPFFTSS
jgi:hypothetical protein